VTTYTVRVRNPIVDMEVMKIETDSRTLALAEAEQLSRRYGIAEVYDNSSGCEIARFKYGVDQFSTGA
jgi:hypothetical protein